MSEKVTAVLNNPDKTDRVALFVPDERMGYNETEDCRIYTLGRMYIRAVDTGDGKLPAGLFQLNADNRYAHDFCTQGLSGR